MFARLGSFATRFRWYIIAGWVIVTAVLTVIAPNINDVAVSDQRAFLPSTAPSLDANNAVKKYFPDSVSPSSAVIVVDAGRGGDISQGGAGELISTTTSWLTGPQAPEAVDEVLSPTHADEMTKASLVSKDKQVGLIFVRFNALGTEPSTEAAMTAIGDRLRTLPAGIKAYMTGDGPILGAYGSNTQGSVDSTTWITIVLVIVILLLIYRSPVSPIIPLVTIAIAYLVARAVAALLGAHVMTISMYTNVFLIVVLFGAGTDYCLFLISRFREEMADAHSSKPAARSTVRAVGETIASSAGTVIVGLATMTAMELGLYNTSGPSLAIGVAIALLAGLTLTPAMLCILGDHSFWPRKARHIKEAGAWHFWAGKVVKRPVMGLIVPVMVLVPLALYGNGLVRDFDLLGDLSKDNEARVGFGVLAAHMGPGAMQPLNVVLVDPARYDTPQGLQRADELAGRLAKLDHVTLVRSFEASLADPRTLSIADQLGVQATAVGNGEAQLEAMIATAKTGDDSARSATDGAAIEAASGRLMDVYGYLSQLAQAYPEVTGDPGYASALKALRDLATLAAQAKAAPGAVAERAVPYLGNLAAGLESLQRTFASQPDAILLPDLYLKNNEGLKALRDNYISADGTAARLQVVLDSGPYSPEALAAVQTIRGTLAADGFNGFVEGNSAVLLDLRDASNRDMTRAIIFVLSGVFVVLILLLRALVAPIYLILTILLSYTATLGVVRLLFVDLLGAAGIVWWVPMFMFVMLVALGMDYNIFLIGRVKEEVTSTGTRPGTRHALARTGGIITSAGVIMAGTFASMMSASILGLLQIGFAVAFGVLLDTFVVRTTLVPAIVVLLGKWSWWPRRRPGHSTDG
ncbi:MAG: MMPL family transporter [Actinobacteria bacterium]|nr:MMPL family transporter [Actinomycetota bacterium]